METLLQDFRYGARMLAKSPGFTAVAVLTLALGIGANTAIFSVVNAVLLRPLPYADPDQLVVLASTSPGGRGTGEQGLVSPDDLADFQAQNRSLAALTGISPQWSLTLTGAGEAERIRGFYANASIFELLGIRPAAGRVFTAEEDHSGAAPVVLLSHGLWQRRFGGAADTVGKSILLDGTAHTVVGVMPTGFRWLDDAEVWLPLALNPFQRRGRQVRYLTAVGHLKPGMAPAQAQAELNAIAQRLASQFPATNAGIGARLEFLVSRVTGPARRALLVLLGAVGFILLIACANVASLLLARATARQREFAIRTALGAGRARLVRQLVTENVVLAIVAGAAGLLVAYWGVDLLVSLSPGGIPRRHEIGVDSVVLGFTAALALLTGILFGLVPALQISRPDLQETLKEGSRGTPGGGRQRHRARSLLVVTEIALAVVVVTGAGLLVRSFLRLRGVDPGFSPQNVVTVGLAMPAPKYADPRLRIQLMGRLYARIESLPGVLWAGDITRVPLAGANNPTTFVEVEGRPMFPQERPEVDFRRAGRNYFRAMGIPLLTGREFASGDTPDAPPVTILNQAAARLLFSGENPLGKRIRSLGGVEAPWQTVVGVVGDIRHVGLHVAPRPEVYISSLQAPPNFPGLVVRAASDPAALIAVLRREIQELEPEMPLSFVTMAEFRDQSVAEPRFQMSLLSVFAGLGLALALVGTYGVMAYAVTQRAHEFGIRVALGAQRRDLLRLVLGYGMKLAASGVSLGLAGALAASRALKHLLFEITPADPLTFTLIALLMTGTALLACWIPARRATRVDPMVALRYE